MQCVALGNIHTSPMEGYWKFQGSGGGGGSQNPKFLKESTIVHEAKGGISRVAVVVGWGSKPKTFCGRGMDIFWNNTIILLMQCNALGTWRSSVQILLKPFFLCFICNCINNSHQCKPYFFISLVLIKK